MPSWVYDLHLIVPVVTGVATYVGLRILIRTVLWNLVLKGMDVNAKERRRLALQAARRDLRLEQSKRQLPSLRGKAPPVSPTGQLTPLEQVPPSQPELKDTE